MTFGVTKEGFVRKGLQEILSEREARNVQAFGAGLIQTAQTPTGQMNGLWSDAEAEFWELAESIYRSLDPDQAEGIRLDELGRLRLLKRIAGEQDDSFAKAITNAGAANVRDADFYRAVRNTADVTWVRIVVSDGEAADASLSPHSVAVCALGGADEDIAYVARQYIVPGITSSGNTRVETNIDGSCRAIRIHRPTEVAVRVEVTVNKVNDRKGCPPPPNVTIAEAVAARLTGDDRPGNGQPITDHVLRLALCDYPTVELVSAQVRKGSGPYVPTPAIFTFDQIASLASNGVTVIVANA